MAHSTVTISEAIDGLSFIPPIKLTVNDNVIYDDYEGDEKVALEDALRERLSDADKYVVTYINVVVVHFHHSIVEMRCEVREDE
jgi:hypothetical protein